MDKNNLAGALLTDLSKALDCLNHELLIAKLGAYGFDYSSLALVYSYLPDKKQRTKIHNSFSTCVVTGIPQGSILGPLIIFNIYLNDIFFFIKENNLTNYADDNTPYAINSMTDAIISFLEEDMMKLLKWFYDNFFKMNADKCHLLITNHEDNVSAAIGGEYIICEKSVKLLGIHIDNKLDFNIHLSKICSKVGSKLHAIARISHLLSRNKLKIIM